MLTLPILTPILYLYLHFLDSYAHKHKLFYMTSLYNTFYLVLSLTVVHLYNIKDISVHFYIFTIIIILIIIHLCNTKDISVHIYISTYLQ